MTQQESEYRVELSVFDGPLDLLVHLVKKNKVDITDIPIHVIVGQYMEYLEWAKKADLQLATSFFEMAATLLAIKAAMLLPRTEKDEGDDPREELMEQIREHEEVIRLKAEIVQRLAEQEDFLERKPTPLQSTRVKGDLSLSRLGVIWERLLEAQASEPVVHTVTVPSISSTEIEAALYTTLRETAVDVMGYLLSFSHKLYQITAFLVVLEAVRQQRVLLYTERGVLYMKGSHDDTD